MTMPVSTFDPPGEFVHTTVMPEQAVAALDPRLGGVYVDATVGGGGHSAAILEACRGSRVVAFDRDRAAVSAARERLARYEDRARVLHAEFSSLEHRLHELNLDAVDGLIADLGVSSQQLEDASRGMSFRAEGPLDMRMDCSSGDTALELIERLSQEELAKVIFQFGQERRSRRVARCIKQSLARRELQTTRDLRRAVVRAVGPHRIGGIDPATRTFQALRIAVNEEMAQLAMLLGALPRIVKPGATVVFISFHSLEDRAVKCALRDATLWDRLGKKPVLPTRAEIDSNPRARSAKLRAARRVANIDASARSSPSELGGAHE
jgi:16S rRNA (cytosine1402-N4)-methyltransferase